MTNHYFLYNSQVTQENASPMTPSVTEVRIHDKYRGRQLLTLPLTLCIALQKPGWVLSENRSLLGFGPLAVLFTILCYSHFMFYNVFFSWLVRNFPNIPSHNLAYFIPFQTSHCQSILCCFVLNLHIHITNLWQRMVPFLHTGCLGLWLRFPSYIECHVFASKLLAKQSK